MTIRPPGPANLAMDFMEPSPGAWAPSATLAPAVTVVLLVCHPTDHELRTAELVRAQRYDGPVSVLMIDSSSDVVAERNQRLREYADSWEAIEPASFGHGSTRNRAVDACRTPIIVFLSQDAHPDSDDWLSALIAPLVRGDAVASYGRQRPPGVHPERSATFSFLYPEEPELKTKADIGRLGIRTFHFSDVTSAFLTDVIRETRFPEYLTMFEDVGVAKRLLDRGYALAYQPDAVVSHAHHLRIRGLFRRYRRIGFVYEQLGIFAELKAASGGLLSHGMRTAAAVAPSATAPGGRSRRLGIAGLKAGAVAVGRAEARMGRG